MNILKTEKEWSKEKSKYVLIEITDKEAQVIAVKIVKDPYGFNVEYIPIGPLLPTELALKVYDDLIKKCMDFEILRTELRRGGCVK